MAAIPAAVAATTTTTRSLAVVALVFAAVQVSSLSTLPPWTHDRDKGATVEGDSSSRFGTFGSRRHACRHGRISTEDGCGGSRLGPRVRLRAVTLSFVVRVLEIISCSLLDGNAK